MASKRAFCKEDFTCPVCYDIFKDPVLLSCGHSVCRVCVQQYWTSKGIRECPLCRKRSSWDPPTNLALKTLSQSYLQARGDPETRCDLHDEELKLYCVDETQLACVVCRESHTHLNHRFRPVDEIAEELKGVVKSALKTISMKQRSLECVQLQYSARIEYIKKQAKLVRNQIKKKFKILHTFLEKEKRTLMITLKAEEQLKTLSQEAKIKNIREEILSLSRTFTQTKEKLDSKNITFIKNFEKTLEKAQCTQAGHKVEFGEVIDVAKYLGNLEFNVWQNMQNIVTYTPVLLDPNTAHRELVLSTDLTSMWDSDKEMKSQQVPDNPEQFNSSLCVLGSEGFSSGVHSWDVEVNNNTFWMVGVTTESIRRKEQRVFPSGVWGIGYDNEKMCARSPEHAFYSLPVAAKLQVVRVLLNMNAGEVRFLDPLTSSVIYMFRHRFTEKVFPFFHSLCSLSPLKILPLQLSWVLANPKYPSNHGE